MSDRPRLLPRFRFLGAVLPAALLALLPGCDDPAATGAPRATVEAEEATAIGVVLPAPNTGFAEVEVWENVARKQEERTRAVVSIYRLAPGDPPSKQSDLIRKAAADGCKAIVLLALDGEAVAPAVAEVRKAGTPVVLLETPVPALGLPAAPLVTYEDEAAVARELVKATVTEARKAGFPDDGPGVILAEKRTDPHTRARIRQLREAMKAAGVRALPDLEFDGLIDEAKDSMKVALEITPHLAMAFALDDLSLRGAAEFRHTLDRKGRRFVLSGYAVEADLLKLIQNNVLGALVERNLPGPMRTAFDTALALSRDETVPTDIRTPTPLTRRNGPEDSSFFSPILERPRPANQKENRADKPADRGAK